MRDDECNRDVHGFRLSVRPHEQELQLDVRVVPFCGGAFYMVRGAGAKTLHILRTDDDRRMEATPQFTVMNADTSDDSVVAAILHALRQPPHNEP